MEWTKLESENRLNELIQESHSKEVAIFKHSTACPISSYVLRAYETLVKESSSQNDTSFYFLDLLSYRPLSTKIAEVLDVRHESPQLLILRNGKVVHHASHSAIVKAQAV